MNQIQKNNKITELSECTLWNQHLKILKLDISSDISKISVIFLLSKTLKEHAMLSYSLFWAISVMFQEYVSILYNVCQRLSQS